MLGVLGALLAVLVAVCCVVLMQSVSRSATQDLQFSRLDSLNRFVQLAMEAEAQEDPDHLLTEMQSYSDLFSEGVVVRVGHEVFSSGGLDPQQPRVSEALHNTGLNLADTDLPTVNPFASGTELLARPFGNSSQVLGAVILEVNPAATRDRVLSGWLVIVGIALVATVVLVSLAWWVTSWVIRPLHRLNLAVQEFTHTGTPKRVAEDGPPELRQLQRSFSAMSAVVTESLGAQRELIAETSHQLRNPIAALRLRVDLLKLKLGETQPQAIQAVEAELFAVERLLASVLRLASAEHRASERAALARGDTPSINDSGIDPLEVLSEELDRIKPQAHESNTELRLLNDAREDLRIRCNGFELSQMIGELLTNALKYGQGSAIDLQLSTAATAVTISVRDHGPGLNPADLVRAGMRFWRGDNQQQIEGSGLGLAIVGRLAEANGGTLKIENASGGGLRATLRFPTVQQRNSAEGP